MTFGIMKFMRFFNKKIKNAVGIDIADQTIEIADLEKDAKGIKIAALSRVILPSGIIELGEIVDEGKLKSAIKAGLKRATPNPIETNKIVFGVPESASYVHTFVLGEKVDNKEELRYLIEEEIGVNVSLEKNDIIYSYQKTLRRDKEEVVVFASSRKYLKKWQEFFASLNLEVVFDFESLALRRSARFEMNDDEAILLMDIGKNTTHLAFFDEKGIRLSHLIKIAGDSFTDSIKEKLSINTEEAEALKKKTDLLKRDEAGEAIELGLEKIVARANEHRAYFEKRFKQKISKIIIAGGSSRIKGIEGWLSKRLGLEVEIAISAFMKVPLEHLEAFGLALRLLDKKYINEPTMEIKNIRTPGTEPANLDKKYRKKQEDKPKQKPFDPSLRHLPRRQAGAQGKLSRSGQAKLGRRKKSIIGEETMKKLTETVSGGGVSKKKTLLIGIVLISIVAIILAFWYRSSQRKERNEVDLPITQLIQTQVMELDLLLGVGDEADGDDRVTGRLVDIKIDLAEDYEEALNRSRTLASKDLNDEEALWEVPLSQMSEEFPITIEWLVYDNEDLKALTVSEIEIINQGVASYELGGIDQLLLGRAENDELFNLKVAANLFIDQLIEAKTNEEELGEAIGELGGENRILINDTETGWLNVRAGPGTSFEVLIKVNPGEIYPLIGEDGNWYNIDIDGIDGWIAALYATKLSN